MNRQKVAFGTILKYITMQMIKNILLSLLLLYPLIAVGGDTIKLWVNDSSRFEGTVVVNEGDTIYRGVLINSNMKIKKGVFRTNFDPSHYRMIYGISQDNNEICYYDQFVINKGWRRSHFTYEKNSKDLYYKNHIAHNINYTVFGKDYSCKKKEWTIIETRNGPDNYNNYQHSTTYNHDGFFSNSEKTISEPFIYYFCYFVIALCGIIMILWPFHRLWPNIISTKIIIGVSAFFPIVFFIVFSSYERIQIVNFIIVFLLLFWSTSLIKKVKPKNWTRILVCSIICPLMVLYCFFSTTEKVELNNNELVPVSWAPGTDFVKRVYMRDLIKNLIPIPIQDNGFQYTLYLNKYEFSEVDFKVITDDTFNWLDLLFTKKPLVDFSYRECRLLIDKINMITGLTFDIPTVNEWECATAGERYIQPKQIKGIKKGNLNRYGLVNIVSNAAEYASNYYSDALKLSLDADSLISSYDFVAICRGDSLGNQKINFVEKNSNEALVTFRLAYRPNNIGKRCFNIVGVLRTDCQNDTLPMYVQLCAINNLPINRVPDFETFQELVIESRFAPKKYLVNDLISNKQLVLILPEGIEYYDFLPLFSFVGLPK